MPEAAPPQTRSTTVPSDSVSIPASDYAIDIQRSVDGIETSAVRAQPGGSLGPKDADPNRTDVPVSPSLSEEGNHRPPGAGSGGRLLPWKVRRLSSCLLLPASAAGSWDVEATPGPHGGIGVARHRSVRSGEWDPMGRFEGR